MRWLVLALCLGLSLSAQAGEVWLHGLSHHVKDGEYNEQNPGFGIELPITGNWSVEGGQYKNSFSRDTRYIWAHYEFVEHGHLRLGAAAGIADGYSDTKLTHGKGVPIGGLTAQYWRFRLLLIPRKDLSRIEVAALSFNILEW